MNFLNFWSKHQCLGTIAFCGILIVAIAVINGIGTVLIRKRERKDRIVARERERAAKACERMIARAEPEGRGPITVCLQEVARFIRSGDKL